MPSTNTSDLSLKNSARKFRKSVSWLSFDTETEKRLTTNADDSRRVARVFVSVSLVCLFVFPHDISNPMQYRITKHDIEMFHDESWKTVHFGVKRSKVKVTSDKNIAGVWVFALLWVLAFSSCW